jgi:hypothetical protein
MMMVNIIDDGLYVCPICAYFVVTEQRVVKKKSQAQCTQREIIIAFITIEYTTYSCRFVSDATREARIQRSLVKYKQQRTTQQ